MIWFVNSQPSKAAPYWIKADFENNFRSYGVCIFTELHKFNVNIDCENWDNIVHERLPWEFLE